MEEPLGMDDITLMIHQGLSLPPGVAQKPQRIEVEGKRVEPVLR